MCIRSQLQAARLNGVWNTEARLRYTTRRMCMFFKKNLNQLDYLQSDPYNTEHWEALFQFFFRKMPVDSALMSECGRVVAKPLYYRAGSSDPLWDRFFIEYQALNAHKLLKKWHTER